MFKVYGPWIVDCLVVNATTADVAIRVAANYMMDNQTRFPGLREYMSSDAGAYGKPFGDYMSACKMMEVSAGVFI